MGLYQYAGTAGKDDRLEPGDITDEALEAFGRNCLETDGDVFRSAFDPEPVLIAPRRSHMENGLVQPEMYDDDQVLFQDLMER